MFTQRLALALLLLGSVPALAEHEDDDSNEHYEFRPEEAMPNELPPPPPGAPPPCEGHFGYQATPSSSAQGYPAEPEYRPAPAPSNEGQWVRTEQFGQLWIPYSQQYTFVPQDPQVYPSQYVYSADYGWRWVVAPWVYGWGPSPQWGAWGPRAFAWYSRPWFRVGGYWGWGGFRGWGSYRGWVGPRQWVRPSEGGSFHMATPPSWGRMPHSAGPGFGRFHGPMFGGGWHHGGHHH